MASPTDVAGLLAWYEADQLTLGAGLANGAAVATWRDQSGNGSDATQATGANQPSVAAASLNGLPAASFNGTSDFLLTTVSGDTKPITVFAVCEASTLATSNPIIGESGAGNGFGYKIGTSTHQEAYKAGVATIITGTAVLVAGAWHYFSLTYDGSGNAAAFLNGVADGTSLNNQTFSSGVGFQIGGNTSFSEFFTGKIAELIIYNSALSTANRQTVETYLAAKYFTTAAAPTVTTDAASGVGTTAATLNGHVTPNNEYTVYHFDYGLTTAYGSSTTVTSFSAGSAAVAVSAALSGLSLGTTYHYRVTATNSTGTTNGTDQTFSTTAGPPPTATTNAASNITATSATLNGNVNPNGADATVHFEYGTTTGYGTSTANQDAGAGSSGVPLSAGITGLVNGTTYHFRVVAVNAGGTTNGLDQSFVAQNQPAIALAPPPLTRAQWEFILCDATGNPLAELSTASGRTIALKRNSYTEVQFSISHEDDAAALLLSALANTGVPKLKCYRRGVNDPTTQAAPLRFRGYLAALSEASEETSLLTATFRSPLGVLVGDGDKTGRFVFGSASRGPGSPPDGFALIYNATDAGSIAKSLVDITNGDGPTGLTTDSARITVTKTRNRTYPPGQNIGAAITDLTAVLDGFDFFESFVDGAGTTDAFFNVVASLGIVNSGVRFEYGPSTLSNVRSLTRTTTPPQNSIFVTGGNGLTSTYQDGNSTAKYGQWWGKADFSSIIEQATLDDKAKGLIRPNPVKTVSIVPDLALSGVPYDDWNLGDTVTLYASRSALTENTQLRINGFTIPIDEQGYETVEVQDPTMPEEDGVIRASLVAEVLDGG